MQNRRKRIRYGERTLRSNVMDDNSTPAQEIDGASEQKNSETHIPQATIKL